MIKHFSTSQAADPHMEQHAKSHQLRLHMKSLNWIDSLFFLSPTFSEWSMVILWKERGKPQHQALSLSIN